MCVHKTLLCYTNMSRQQRRSVVFQLLKCDWFGFEMLTVYSNSLGEIEDIFMQTLFMLISFGLWDVRIPFVRVCISFRIDKQFSLWWIRSVRVSHKWLWLHRLMCLKRTELLRMIKLFSSIQFRINHDIVSLTTSHKRFITTTTIFNQIIMIFQECIS